MVFQAGFVGFVKTLLIFAGIYYALKFLLRFLFPWLVKNFLKKQFSNYNNQQSSQSSSFQDTTRKQEEKKAKKDQLGEYVDYEEIKEKD